MKFSYKATGEDGNPVVGVTEAQDKFELNRILRGQGLILISAEDENSASPLKKFWKKMSAIGTVKEHQKIIFGKNLSSMLEAGLPMSRALTVMGRQTKSAVFKKIIKQLSEDIKRGLPLSAALERHPRTFPPLFVSMVTAGEESGNLVDSLHVVSEQMEKTLTLKKKVRGAMIYPGVIVGVMVVIAIFMFVFIVPTLTKTFVELELDLPASTQFIISTSNAFKEHTTLMIAGTVAFFVSFIVALKTVRGRRILDWIFLHIPMINGLVRKTNSARTARTLSSLLNSGVSYVRSIEITGDVVQNSFYKSVIAKAAKNIQLGLPIAKVFEENQKLYPVFVSEMIAVGEETGDLTNMLMKVASYYEAEVDEQTKNLSQIIEPFLMVMIGGGVGFFAVSMISPMYSLVDNI